MNILRLHFDAAGLATSTIRYLKIERVACKLRIFPNRLIAAHSVSPCIASNWDNLDWQIRLSCGANMAREADRKARDLRKRFVLWSARKAGGRVAAPMDEAGLRAS